jgi:hypothetical protein
MTRSLFSVVTASALIAGAGLASATTTTTQWTPDQGTTITQYSTTQHYRQPTVTATASSTTSRLWLSVLLGK